MFSFLVRLCLVILPFAPLQAEVHLKLACAAVGLEFKLCQTAAEEWSKKTGNKVTVVGVPNQASDRLTLYQQLLNNSSQDLDIFLLDLTWMSLLEPYFIDLQSLSSVPTFAVLSRNNRVGKKFVAAPLYIDVGMLFYRKDLLQEYALAVPQTWEELESASKKVQDGERRKGNKRFWGYVFQGRAYEGLTCNLTEWLGGAGVREMISPEGRVQFATGAGAKMLQRVTQWIGKISPRGVLNYGEEESRGVFQSGNAAFLRNWPYVLGLAEAEGSPIKGKVGFTSIPHEPGQKSAATIGGWSLAVSKFSRAQKEAIDFVRYITGPEEQKNRYLVGGFHPTIPGLYQDADLLKKNAALKELLPMIESSVARPSTYASFHYPRVSGELWTLAHEALVSKKDFGLQKWQTRIQKTLEKKP